jgi:hypothetical protein
MENALISRKRQVAGNIMIYLGAFGLFAGGCAKFAHVPKVVDQLTSMGLGGDKLLLVASLEVLAALLFAFRPVRLFGVLFLSAYLGGAVCAHVQHGPFLSFLAPAIPLGACWLGTFLRHPQAFWSIDDSKFSSKQYASVSRRPVVQGQI